MFDWFHKALLKNTFYALLEMILHLDFSKKMLLIKRGLGGQKGGCNKIFFIWSI